MSILITGLELPEDKTVQIIIENKRFGGVYCNTLGEKGLHRLGRVEETVFKLPAEHGDLIDRDKLRVDYLWPSSTTNTPVFRYVSADKIEAAPAIIPAEVDE